MGLVAAAVCRWRSSCSARAQYLIGQGLGEISSAGLLSHGRAVRAAQPARRDAVAAVAAGVLATLAFYTRLNNLPMALGAVALFALPDNAPALVWRAGIATIVSVVRTLASLLFAWRTWHYTGVFSIFYGTQRDLLVDLAAVAWPLVTILQRDGSAA